jgi:hypothetical protein
VTRESAMVRWLAQPYGKADVDLRRFVDVDFMKIREATDYPTIIDENHCTNMFSHNKRTMCYELMDRREFICPLEFVQLRQYATQCNPTANARTHPLPHITHIHLSHSFHLVVINLLSYYGDRFCWSSCRLEISLQRFIV